MTQRNRLNEVKMRVRSDALLFRTFTAEDIVRSTNFNPSSVQTELQRMKQEGFLTSQRQSLCLGQRGRAPHLYSVTSDVEQRLKLAESVKSMYAVSSNTKLTGSDAPIQPERREVEESVSPAYNSPAYSLVFSQAELLLSLAEKASEPARLALLSQAETLLNAAEKDEALFFASDVAMVHLELAYARLAYLRCDFLAARTKFAELRTHFVNDKDQVRVREVDEYLLASRFCLGSHSKGEGDLENHSSLPNCLSQEIMRPVLAVLEQQRMAENDDELSNGRGGALPCVSTAESHASDMSAVMRFFIKRGCDVSAQQVALVV